jgi:hypothetical protein
MPQACIAFGEDYDGEHACQAFDCCWIRVRRHADGRTLVYGFAGDAQGGGRPEREDRWGGNLLGADEADDHDVARVIRDVAAGLGEVRFVGSGMAAAAGRRCIANMLANMPPTRLT